MDDTITSAMDLSDVLSFGEGNTNLGIAPKSKFPEAPSPV